MFRFLVVLLLAICIAGGVAYFGGYVDQYLPKHDGSGVDKGERADKTPVNIGEFLYQPMELPNLPHPQPAGYSVLPLDLCSMIPHDTQEVSSPKPVEGPLLFVGEDLTGQALPPQVKGSRPVVSKKIFDGEKTIELHYRPLQDNDTVKFGQVVAVINPAFARRDLESKTLKVIASIAKFNATKSILNETKRRLDTLYRLRAKATGIVSDIEIGDAEVSVAKYNGEYIDGEQNIRIAYSDWAQAMMVQEFHYLKSEIPGESRVRKIFKKEGEAIKPQDPILQLWSINRMKVEGSADSQYFNTLQAHKNAQCYLEPSVQMEPKVPLMQAHVAEVTSVAFLADGKRFVSGSEDHRVYVWQDGLTKPINRMPMHHKAAVRCLAASPKGAWIAVGCDDGSIIRWNLDEENPEPVEFKNAHRGRVTALAFSGDGEYLASGGEDNMIILHKVADAELVYKLDEDHGALSPHQGTITSLSFTPQCTLVSAARDNTLRVWKLGTQGVEMVGQPIANRDGTVNRLGVSHDGRYLLFDKSKTLHLLNASDHTTACVLENLAGANAFDTLALFSPDGSLILTGGAGEGRLHLWKAPTPEDRAYQVRELVTEDRSNITTAAFAPAGRQLAVTGSKQGYVHIWRLPDKAAVQNHRILVDSESRPLKLDVVEPSIEAGKTRVVVNVLNPLDALGEPRLKPGQRVTLVVILPTGK
jgi:WD40 repeat protein